MGFRSLGCQVIRDFVMYMARPVESLHPPVHTCIHAPTHNVYTSPRIGGFGGCGEQCFSRRVCVRERVLFCSCIGKSNSPTVVEVHSSSGTPGMCMCTCMYVCTQNSLITRPTSGDKQFHSVFGTPVRKSAPTSTHVHTHAHTHAAACTHAHITSSIK